VQIMDGNHECRSSNQAWRKVLWREVI